MYSNFYKIPLPALGFEKVEETNKKSENDTEENDAFQIDHVRGTKKMTLTVSTEKQFHPQARTRKGTQTLPELRNTDRKRTSISAFKKRQPEQPRNRQRQPDQSKGSEKTKTNRIFL